MFLVGQMPEWMSVVPPLVAIAVALLLKEVISALLISVVSGGVIMAYYEGGLSQIYKGIFMPMEYIQRALSPENGDVGHVSVILFSLLIGGMVSVVIANGSMAAMVKRIAKKATTKKRGLLATWLMGVLVFFDDYANTMIVGQTMRPLTDKLGISRAKLAYIVDSTAAPMAAIALVTTWIGAELIYIQDGISGLEGFPVGRSSYLVFLDSLKFMFYPVLALIFILILIYTGKDFGPMLKAENVVPTDESKQEYPENKSWKGIVPIMVMLFGTITMLFVTGYDSSLFGDSNYTLVQKLSAIIGNSDSYTSLIWASFASIVVAVLLSLNSIGFIQSIEACMEGFKKMLPAIVILVLAWSLAGMTEEMNTAGFIGDLMIGKVSPVLLPLITFVAASVIAFSTGSSWGTMAILYPVVIGTSWHLGMDIGLTSPENYYILTNVVSAVLAGSVLGDHCSPISDTTILSSLASSCNHVDHVRTQLPYALTVGIVAMGGGTLLSSVGVPVWLCYILSIIVLFLIVSYFGQRKVQ